MPRGDGRLARSQGQTSRHLSGDVDGAVEQMCRRLRVFAPDGVTHLSEDLVQILAEGAQMPACASQLQLGMGRLLAVPILASEELQAPDAGLRPAGLAIGGMLPEDPETAVTHGAQDFRRTQPDPLGTHHQIDGICAWYPTFRAA